MDTQPPVERPNRPLNSRLFDFSSVAPYNKSITKRK